ncbi:unnamed protein product [Darwinula stevensoni]|uniref:Elongation of very long chain fatty acids protein n=1 Tax=Darwinula stevensoni TaxID=69355 RepID=A0A7R8X3U5_9CRUS|nr:unnamed protein product [Darwinula stevensoni]CAG0878920.1 unnamed protein product [Darwinula stevensoni]
MRRPEPRVRRGRTTRHRPEGVSSLPAFAADGPFTSGKSHRAGWQPKPRNATSRLILEDPEILVGKTLDSGTRDTMEPGTIEKPLVRGGGTPSPHFLNDFFPPRFQATTASKRSLALSTNCTFEANAALVYRANSFLRFSHVRHNPVAGNWGMLFAFSKVFELGDTAFIVLRKQRLLFLHWYHHITVLLYAWYSYGQAIPTARYFITFNFLAHALMYPYYMMKALKIQVPRRIAMGVTLFQLSQMVVGVTVNTYAYLCIRAGMHCEVPMENIQVSFLMYLSYLILFAKFFIDAYVKRSLAKATKEYKAAVASGKPTANGHPTITEEFTDYLKIN